MDPRNLRADEATVFTHHRLMPGSRRWTEHFDRSGLPKQDELLPEKTQIVKGLASIWLGGPLLDEAFRANVGRAADRYRGQAVFPVFTDVPRADFDLARRITPGQPVSDHLAGVRSMLNWAAAHPNVLVVNIHEVFNATAPMIAHPYFMAEANKPVGTGKAAASNIARAEIVLRLGLGYSDGDNLIGDHLLDDLRNGLKSPAGYAAGGGYKSFYAAFAGHPLFRGYLTRLAGAYTRNQDHVTRNQDLDAGWDMPKLERDHLNRRDSVYERLGDIEADGVNNGANRKDAFQEPASLTVTQDNTWKEDNTKKARPRTRLMTAAQTRTLTRQVVGTLAKDLWNRNGDLHLTYVEPAVLRHPHPELIWNAAIRLLQRVPETARQMRTVTDARLTDNHGRQVVKLPAEARRLLNIAPRPKDVDGVDTDADVDTDEHADLPAHHRETWVRGERTYPATFVERTPTGPAPGKSGDWETVAPPPVWEDLTTGRTRVIVHPRPAAPGGYDSDEDLSISLE
jgi:hypothetical protein